MRAQEKMDSRDADNSQAASRTADESQAATKYPVPPEEESDLWWYRQLYQDVEFQDDVRGGSLNKELMIKARRAEIHT